MDKEAILKTAIVIWSDEDECFISYSPLTDVIVGAGDSADEALERFKMHVDVHFEEYLAGRHGSFPKEV